MGIEQPPYASYGQIDDPGRRFGAVISCLGWSSCTRAETDERQTASEESCCHTNLSASVSQSSMKLPLAPACR